MSKLTFRKVKVEKYHKSKEISLNVNFVFALLDDTGKLFVAQISLVG